MITMYLLQHTTFPGGTRTIAFLLQHAFSALPDYIQKYCAVDETSDMSVQKIVVSGDKFADNHGIFEVMYTYEDGPWQYSYYTDIKDAAKWVVDTCGLSGYRIVGITEIQVYGD